jgi:hypothetical protein
MAEKVKSLTLLYLKTSTKQMRIVVMMYLNSMQTWLLQSTDRLIECTPHLTFGMMMMSKKYQSVLRSLVIVNISTVNHTIIDLKDK